MSDITITLVNRCDDDHDAKVTVYQSRSSGEDGGAPELKEIEVPGGTSQELRVPEGPRYFIGVEDIGPNAERPGRRDTVEVDRAGQTVEISGSLTRGLRVALVAGPTAA